VDGGEVKKPKSNMAVAPKVLYGHAREVSSVDEDRLDAFVEWLTSAENPFFAKSMSNRVWSYFFGRGIIDPVDDIRASNPASNPALLDALEKDFLAHEFDLPYLMRTIANSRAYQSSIDTNEWNEKDADNFSHATPRRLSAEELMAALAVATGVEPCFRE